MLQLKDKCESLLNEKEVIMVKYDIENCIDLIITRKYKYKEERINYETYEELKEDYKRLLSTILKTNDVSTKKLERDIKNEKLKHQREKERRSEDGRRQRDLHAQYTITPEKLKVLRTFKTIKQCEDYLGLKLILSYSSNYRDTYHLEYKRRVKMSIDVIDGVIDDIHVYN